MNWRRWAITGTTFSYIFGRNRSFGTLRIVLTLCLVRLITPGLAIAQDSPPQAMALAPGPNLIMVERPKPKVRTFNRSFTVLALLSAAAMVADVELTANCLKTVPNCRESNPLMGSDPSRARLYGVNVPIYAGTILLSRMLRHRSPDRKVWMTPFLSFTGAHVVGVSSDLWAR